MSSCNVQNCPRPVHGQGYCSRHYHWARENGLLGVLREATCVVAGCSFKVCLPSETLCSKHLNQAKGYRLTDDQFGSLVNILEANCWLCGSLGTSVDHDHECGGRHARSSGGCSRCVRGWLCGTCNWLLGTVKESIDKLERLRYTGSRERHVYERAIHYLEAGSGEGRFERLVEAGFFGSREGLRVSEGD